MTPTRPSPLAWPLIALDMAAVSTLPEVTICRAISSEMPGNSGSARTTIAAWRPRLAPNAAQSRRRPGRFCKACVNKTFERLVTVAPTALTMRRFVIAVSNTAAICAWSLPLGIEPRAANTMTAPAMNTTAVARTNRRIEIVRFRRCIGPNALRPKMTRSAPTNVIARPTAPTKGIQVVFTKQYPAAAPDLSGLISQAKAKNPDIVMNSGHLAEAIAINKAAKQLGLNAKIFAYSVGPSTPDFINSLGADANYVYDGSQWTPQVKYKPTFYLSVADYVKAYKAKYSTSDDPDYHVAESTAACLAFQKAMENAGSLDPQKVRDALASLDVMTFFGQIKFDSRGINIYKPMVVEQIQNGTHYTVFPTDVANGAPKYPTPAWSSR